MRAMVQEPGEIVKENKLPVLPLTWHWLCAGLALSALAMAAVTRIDHALPAPLTRSAPPERFIAEIAHEHLVNLTAIGPRVAGSYENEVQAVALLVSTIKSIAANASPHNRLELDVQRVSGNFSLTFMDGMNNVYRDVQNVVVRVSGAGGRQRGRTAILLNCHFDTVPDSPGASDDGAGCAVLLETLRALAATRRPLRHDAVFLFNGAEENILQASHGFITQHKWAKSVRAFINIEACGAGGREVMFQAGPHDPWIVEVYAGAVPHPFASSLAQELFQSGMIPADTDFRIFRDFGKLSGVDLAWSSNGYVYHTRLDTAAGVPAAALQRTGDNVLALARGLLASDAVEAEADEAARQPVFFDVLGWCVVSLRAPAAAALSAGTLALLLLKLRLSALAARRAYAAPHGWAREVLAAAACALRAGAGGVLAAAAAGAALHALGARLSFYARPALLAPLFAAPALGASWLLAARGGRRLRGWWAARAWHDALAALAGAALLGCVLRGLRSGFLPLLWVLLPSLADVLASLTDAPRAACWVLGAAVPLLQTCYLAANSLDMFVPIMGRAGSGALPPDVTMAIISAALLLAALSWLLPFVAATRAAWRVAAALLLAGALGAALALGGSLGGLGAYSAARPLRLMLFHTRRTVHAPGGDSVDEFYWVPELDSNTARAVARYVGRAEAVSAAECARWVYCGAPYYLPVLGLVGRSLRAAAPAGPRARLAGAVRVLRAGGRAVLEVDVAAAPAHVVLVVAPARGAELRHAGAAVSAAWGARRTHFFLLHAARAPRAWSLRLELRGEGGAALPPGPLADVSLAGHAMFGADKLHAEHARALAALPPEVAGTGWGVDLHLYSV